MMPCARPFPLPMAQYFTIHPDHPQPRLIRQAAEIVRAGGVIVYPTDSCYALGCRLGDKDAERRIREIRGVDAHHPLTLVVRDLSEIAVYAKVDNAQFRLLKTLTPGPYTFVLRATREVPRRLMHPRRATIGIRVPDHAVAQALLAELGEPLLSSTLVLPGANAPVADPETIRSRLEKRVALILDAGFCGIEPTTVVDLLGPSPEVLRKGRGSLAPLGLVH